MLLTLLCLQPQQSNAETLPNAVQRAVASQPEIRSLLAKRMASRADVDLSKSLRRPGINLSASSVLMTADSSGSRSETSPSAVSLSASQPIYDGGVASAELRRSRSGVAAANQRLGDALNTVALQTVQAYIEVLRLREVRKILSENIASLQAIAQRVQLRADNGFGSDADVFEARARVDSAKYQLVEAEQQLRDAVSTYRSLVGHEPERLEPIQMLTKFLPEDVDHAVREARTHSPRILAVRYDALSAYASIDSSKAQSNPKLDLVLGMDYNKDLKRSASDANDLFARVSFRMPLYDGGATRARVAEARYTAESARLSAEATALDVEREIRLAWNGFASTRQKTQPLMRQFQNASKSLKLNLKRFDAGLTTLEKIMDLQTQKTSAQLALLNEEVSGRYFVFRVLGGTGQLAAALGVRLPEMVN
mgnify:CR=1 FL=1